MAMIANIISSNEPELMAAAEAARLGSTKSHLHNIHRKKWIIAQAKHFKVSLPFMARFVKLMNMSSEDKPQCISHLVYAFRGTKNCEITRNRIMRSIIERWLAKGYVSKMVKQTDKGSSFKGFITTNKGWWPMKETIFNSHSFSTKTSDKVAVTGDYYVRMVSKSLDKCIETKRIEEMPLLVYSDRAALMSKCEDVQYRVDHNISAFKAGIYEKVQKAAQNKVEFIARSPDDDRGRAYKLFSEEDIIADKSLRYAVKSATTDPIDGDTVEPI